MFIIPVTDELSLRLLMKKDAERLFELVNQSRVYLGEWLPWVEHVSKVEDYHLTISRWLQSFAQGEELNMGIDYQGQLVGVCGFHYFDRLNKKTSIGYWIGFAYQGRGIMTVIVRKMVELAFQEFAMNRVEIRCGVNNHRSRAIPKKLGFAEEGTMKEVERVGDRYVDHVVYGMTKQEWKKNKY